MFLIYKKPPLQDAPNKKKVSSSAVFGIFPQHLLGCQIWTFAPQIPFWCYPKGYRLFSSQGYIRILSCCQLRFPAFQPPPKKKTGNGNRRQCFVVLQSSLFGFLALMEDSILLGINDVGQGRGTNLQEGRWSARRVGSKDLKKIHKRGNPKHETGLAIVQEMIRRFREPISN